MRILPSLLGLALAAVPLAAQKPRATPVTTLEVANTQTLMSPDGHRLYYDRDSTTIRVYDRRSRQDQVVLQGRKWISTRDISRDGRTLLIEGEGEDDGRIYIFTVPLDPATGTAAGSPRRVSMTWGENPAFSSDGRYIAFAARAETPEEQLVVVPSNGGPERTLLQTGGAFHIFPIRWSPDDRYITYGVSEAQPTPQLRNATYRIPSAGGTPERLLATADWGGYPGLSSDGRLLVARDPSWDSIIVATADGRRLAAYAGDVYWGEEPEGWISGTRAWSSVTFSNTAIQVHTLGGGAPRTLSDTGSIYNEPRWSPDGRRTAAAMERDTGIVIHDLEGRTTRIRTRLPVANEDGVHWSPDGRSLAYRLEASWATPHEIAVVDLATGQHRTLARGAARTVPIRWTASGRQIIYGTVAAEVAADSTRQVTLREVSLAGGDRVLRTLRSGCPVVANDRCLNYLNDSTILLRRPGSLYVVADLHGRTPDRVVVDLERRSGQGVASVSENGRWAAVRRLDDQGRQQAIELVGTDGTGRRVLSLPFHTAAGRNNPWISDDGRELIVAAQAPRSTQVTYYRVDVATGTPTRLFSVQRGYGLGSLSPDRRFLATSTRLNTRTAVYELDFSQFVPATGGRPPR